MPEGWKSKKTLHKEQCKKEAQYQERYNRAELVIKINLVLLTRITSFVDLVI